MKSMLELAFAKMTELAFRSVLLQVQLSQISQKDLDIFSISEKCEILFS